MSTDIELSNVKQEFVSNVLLESLTSQSHALQYDRDDDSDTNSPMYFNNKSQELSSVCSSSDSGDVHVVNNSTALKPDAPPVPNMWSRHYVGLYAQYAIGKPENMFFKKTASTDHLHCDQDSSYDDVQDHIRLANHWEEEDE